MVPGNPGMSGIPFYPLLEREVLSENSEYSIVRETDGSVVKYAKAASGVSITVSFPVADQAGWDALKHRIDWRTHDFGGNYTDAVLNYRTNENPNCIFICGLYGFLRNLMGDEMLAFAFYDQPELLRGIADHWLRYYAEVCGRLIGDMRIDFMMFFEDICYKTGPLVSPAMFREFLMPYFKDLLGHFRGLGVKNFMVDTDGNVDEALPLYVESGFNMMDPFEQAAGNDILAIREKYPEFIIWGGLDKRVLNGSTDDISREIYSKVPKMWEKGGFIPSIDHLILQPCPMENFAYFVRLIDEICK
jgi:uroporphyrinogen decarboxylase